MSTMKNQVINRQGLCLALLLGAGLCAGAQGAVTTVILNDGNSGDNFLYNNGATTNFANSGLFYYDNRGGANDSARPVIQFGLAGLPGGAVISNVQLQFKLQQYTYIDSNNGNASVTHNFSVHQMLTSWSETTSTWNERSTGNAWSAPGMAAGADYAAAALSTIAVNSSMQGTYLSWDITSLYNSWVSGANQNFGVCIQGPAGVANSLAANGDTTDGVFRLYNSEYADDTFRPLLVITYTVPSPASLAAFGAGGLILLKRRRTKAS
ncbi:MAG: DNRLRE domain-containing protein [Phycisphaeraceae bacterium]|nr:DNRLRE domain-containing protein [Phycisphaeraceae bacterium]